MILGMYILGSNYKRSSFLDLWQQLCWQVSPKEQSHDNINADSLRLSLLHVDLICLEPEMRHCTSYTTGWGWGCWKLACWTKPGKQDSNNSLSAVGMEYRRRRKRGHSSIVILFVNFSPDISQVYLSDHIDITCITYKLSKCCWHHNDETRIGVTFNKSEIVVPLYLPFISL